MQKIDRLSLIKSISGIRGTIGGEPGKNLTPIDIVSSTAGYAHFLQKRSDNRKVVVGRDARLSGSMLNGLVINTLIACGFDVVDLGLSTTPTVEMMVSAENAAGGIVLTASHNPKEWNALKFLNEKGEFISANDGQEIIDTIANGQLDFSSVGNIGKIIPAENAFRHHIQAILELSFIDKALIKSKHYKVVLDPINSTGSLVIPPLLKALGCEVISIHDDCSGNFAHNPEPLADHLKDLSTKVKETGADLGISVDPDVDRLALVMPNGEMFGEEYTLVAAAEAILRNKPGNTVSNLSSTRALADVTRQYGGEYYASAVGEVNVVQMMKDKDAVIGGEGNGGVILPDLHYGRDALVGIVLILQLLSELDCDLISLKNRYPQYMMAKTKIQLTDKIDADKLLSTIAEAFKYEKIDTIDGVKIDFEEGWVHMRKSNTEPILRLYAEAKSKDTLYALTEKVQSIVEKEI